MTLPWPETSWKRRKSLLIAHVLFARHDLISSLQSLDNRYIVPLRRQGNGNSVDQVES